MCNETLNTFDSYVNQTEVLVGKDKESEAKLSIKSLSFYVFAHEDANQSQMFKSLVNQTCFQFENMLC